MKIKILKLIILIGSVFVFIPNVIGNELTLMIPTPSGQEDLNIQGSTSINTDRTELIDIINIVNKYLRFSLGLIAMVIFVYAGIKLIVFGQEEFKKANSMLLGAGVAIIVAMLSYTIINLLINLF